MPHMLNLHHPRLLLQQHRPLRIPRQAPIEERCSLFDTEPGMAGERDPEDVAELFQTQRFGFRNDTLVTSARERRGLKKTLPGHLQQNYYFADDAPSRVPDESSIFVERFVEGRPGDDDHEV
jgi:hypothetical protein